MDFLNKLCRLCLLLPGEKYIYDMIDLLEDIDNILGIKIKQISNLPDKICSNCADVLLKAKSLKQKATENEVYLLKLYNNNEDSNEYMSHNDDSDDDRLVIDEAHYSEDAESLADAIENNNKDRSRSPQAEVDKLERQRGGIKISIRRDLFSPTKFTCISISKDDSCNSKSLQDREILNPNISNIIKKNEIKHEKKKEFPHNCSICGKKFTTARQHINHKRTHSKSHACPIGECGKSFATKGDVDRHVRVHTGEKPYSCHLCEKKFTQKGTLKGHIESMHSS